MPDRPAGLHPAIVRAVDPVARTASLQLSGAAGSWLEDVPLAAHLDASSLAGGDSVLLALGPGATRPGSLVVALRPATPPRAIQPMGDLVALAPATGGSWYGPIATLPDDAGGLAVRGLVPADLAGTSLTIRVQLIAAATGDIVLRTRLACFADGDPAPAWNIDAGTNRTVAAPAVGGVVDLAWTVTSGLFLPGRPLGLLLERQADASTGIVRAGPAWLDYPRA